MLTKTFNTLLNLIYGLYILLNLANDCNYDSLNLMVLWISITIKFRVIGKFSV